MKIDILTLFPKMFDGPLSESILKRARDDGKVEINIHNLRDWAEDKHKTTDLPPYGGGPGMVMKVDVIDRAVEELKMRYVSENLTSEEPLRVTRATASSEERFWVVLLDTKGAIYNQMKAKELAKFDHLILIAGHYEGVDHRVHEHVADEVISIGEYVLTGGEIPAMVVVDSLVRLIPGVLGNAESLQEESYGERAQHSGTDSTPEIRRRRNTTSGEKPSSAKIQYPQYTRPEEYKGWKVPKVLLSGNYAKIVSWRNKHAD